MSTDFATRMWAVCGPDDRANDNRARTRASANNEPSVFRINGPRGLYRSRCDRLTAQINITEPAFACELRSTQQQRRRRHRDTD